MPDYAAQIAVATADTVNATVEGFVAPLQAQITALEQDLATAIASGTASQQEVVKLKAEIVQLKDHIKDLEAQVPTRPVREARVQSFTSASFFNVAMGDGAILESASDPATKALQSFGAGTVNCAKWSYPKYFADDSTPTMTLTQVQYIGGPQNGGPWTVQLQKDAEPGGGTDAPMIAFQSDGRYAFEIYKATWNANRTAMTSSSVRKVDTWSDGYVPGAQAAQIPAHGGLITPEELKTGVINHILMISAPGLLLKDGYKWPARGQDSHANTIQSDGKPFYRGPLPMGTMLALPRNITDASLGLATVQGKGVAKTMRERGGYIKVAASTVCLYVQPNGADLALVNALIPDWKKILKQLVVVTNSTAANPGGPGNRLAPNVPLLASEMV